MFGEVLPIDGNCYRCHEETCRISARTVEFRRRVSGERRRPASPLAQEPGRTARLIILVLTMSPIFADLPQQHAPALPG